MFWRLVEHRLAVLSALAAVQGIYMYMLCFVLMQDDSLYKGCDWLHGFPEILVSHYARCIIVQGHCPELGRIVLSIWWTRLIRKRHHRVLPKQAVGSVVCIPVHSHINPSHKQRTERTACLESSPFLFLHFTSETMLPFHLMCSGDSSWEFCDNMNKRNRGFLQIICDGDSLK